MKYKNSLLGIFWSLLHPLAYLLIFIVIFSNAFADEDRYALFALIGLVYWTYFNNSMIQIQNSLIQNSSVLKTIAVPRLLFPLSATLSELITLGISIIPFFILMVFFGLKLTPETLLFIPVTIIFGIFTFGFALLLCTLNVFFRDVGLLWTTLSPALFYFTPIAYSSRLIPENRLGLLKFNPLYHYIELVRTVLYKNEIPTVSQWMITAGMAIGICLFSLLIYNKLKKDFISFY